MSEINVPDDSIAGETVFLACGCLAVSLHGFSLALRQKEKASFSIFSTFVRTPAL